MNYLLSNCTISDAHLRRYRIIFNKCSVHQPGINLTNEELIMVGLTFNACTPQLGPCATLRMRSRALQGRLF